MVHGSTRAISSKPDQSTGRRRTRARTGSSLVASTMSSTSSPAPGASRLTPCRGEAPGHLGRGVEGAAARGRRRHPQAGLARGAPDAGAEARVGEEAAGPAHRDGRAEAELRGEIGHQVRQRGLGARDDGTRDGMSAPRRAQCRRRQRGHARHRVGRGGRDGAARGRRRGAARRGARRGRSRTPSPRRPEAGPRPPARAEPAAAIAAQRDGAGAGEEENARRVAEGAVARRLHVGDHAHAPGEAAQPPPPPRAAPRASTRRARPPRARPPGRDAAPQRRMAARRSAGRARTATAPRRRRRVRPAPSRASTRSVVPPRSQPMAHVARARGRPRIRVGMIRIVFAWPRPTRRA